MLDELLAKLFESPKVSLVVGVVLLVIVGSFAWWQFVWTNPQQVFEDMLTRNLMTTSVTKRVTASQGDQGIDQIIRLQLGSVNAADWLVTAKQSGSMVATESVATPKTGYVRYTQITSTQKNAHGQNFDFGPVLNLWAKSDGTTDASLNTLFDQTLLDITSAPAPPIGNLPADQRDNLISYMSQEAVFVPDYTKVKHETVNGRLAYAYSVTVKLGPYVRMMQAFAHDMGIKTLDQVDPTQYDNLSPVVMTMWVDPSSHQLVKLSYASSGFTEGYDGWGLETPIVLPTKTITTTALQQRLQALGN